MSRLPSTGARPSNSLIFSAMRLASGTPRRRIPTRTSSSTPLLRSTISCAMRVTMRRRPSASTISAFSRSAMGPSRGRGATWAQPARNIAAPPRARQADASHAAIPRAATRRVLRSGDRARGRSPENLAPGRPATRFSLESGARARQNPQPEVPLVRRTLPHLLLAIIAFARPATAQIDVALSPFPVQQQPVGYQTFGDGSGGVWAVFQGAQSGAALYAQHVLANGAYAAGFGPAARQVAHSGTLVNSISAAPDGLGGALVVWFGVNPLDSTSQSVALRAQHLDAQGTNQYPDSGLVVSSIAGAAMAVGDGQGGLYVAWEELKSPTNPDIVAQHFGNFGDPLWSPSGSPTGRNVCAVVGIQRLRAIQEDGAGGAYVAWADSRVPGTVPLYGMRLTPGGVAAAPWPAQIAVLNR